MKNKLAKSLSIVTAVSASGLMASQVYAEESAPSSTEEMTNTTTVTAKTLATQEGVVSRAESRMDSAANNVSQKQQQLATARKAEEVASRNLASAESNLSSATANLADATPETISATKDAITELNKKVETARDKVATSNDTLSDVTTSFNKQADVVNAANTVVNNAEDQVTKAKSSVALAEKALRTTNTDELKAQKGLAEQNMATKTTAVETAQTNLTKARAAETQLNKDKVQAQSTLANAKEQLTVAKDEQAQKQNAVTRAIANVSEIKKQLQSVKSQLGTKQTFKATPEYIAALKVIGDSNATDEDYAKAQQTLARINKKQLELNHFVSNPADDEVILDPQNLTTTQRQELALFAVDLINQIRSQMGTKPLQITATGMAFADKTTDNYKANHPSNTTGDHDVKAIMAAAKDVGLRTSKSNIYENRGSILGNPETLAFYSQKLNWDFREPISYVPTNETFKLTMNDMKRMTFRMIELLFFNGVEWLHAASTADVYSLTTNSSLPRLNRVYGGVDFTSYNDGLAMHLLMYNEALVSDKSRVDNTPLKLKSSSLEGRLQAKLQEQTAKLQTLTTELETAKSKTQSVQTTYDKALADLNRSNGIASQTSLAEKALKEAELELASAKQKLAEVTTALEINGKSQAEKEALVASTKADLAKKQGTLTAAKNLLVAELDKLENLKVARDKVDAKLRANQKILSSLLQDLKTNEKRLSDLENAGPLLEKAKAAYSEALVKKQEVAAQVEADKAELANRKTLLETAKAKYLNEKAIYDAMVLAQLQAKHDQLVAEGKRPVAVYEGGKLVDYVAENPRKAVESHSQKSERQMVQTALNQQVTREETIKVLNHRQSSKVYGALLPNTGDAATATVSLMGMLLFTLGLAGVRKRRLD